VAEKDEQWETFPVDDGDMDDPSWSLRSSEIEDLTPLFSFLLGRTVYVGDPNSAEQMRSGDYDRPLRLPDFGARDPLRPTADEVRGREPELAAYYRQVMELKGQPRSGEPGYWLSLDIVSETAQVRIPFPWWDRISDAAPFLAWLRTCQDGAAFGDCDQGWFLRAERKGQRIHFLDGDLDTRDAVSNSSVSRSVFLDLLDTAESDVRAVIAALKAELGVDPWS
jgi:hypothetical protein